MKKIIFILFLLFCSVSVFAATLTIETEKEKISLKTEIADNSAKRARGLMFRDSISDDYGMIFLFPHKEVIYMWMKNTKISLDMLFFDENGHIVKIIENAIPYDLTLLSSEEPVIGVVEVKGGFIQKNNVSIGNKIHLLRDSQ